MSNERKKVIAKHLKPSSTSSVGSLEKQLRSRENKEGGKPLDKSNIHFKQSTPKRIESAVPRIRQELLKWNGWGYKDTEFIVKNDVIYFTGDRYPLRAQALPYFAAYAKEIIGMTIGDTKANTPQPSPKAFPEPNIEKEFLNELITLKLSYSVKGEDRLLRSHGQNMDEIFILRGGEFERIPDLVVWPECHDHVVSLVNMADRYGVVVIPFGGGTSVTGAVTCPTHEKRTILSLDTSQMNRILWVDSDNLVACIEAGIIGQDLERELQKQGFTTGHEPDSYEFSSLGGWVATRASGMKKNQYGNIEDLLVHVRMVTPAGVLEKNSHAARMSCGPDFNHIVLGSEGTFGVITEVTLKIRPLPKTKKYGSIVFPNFEAGVAFMREVARQRCQPASVRLMDNQQLKGGLCFKSEQSYMEMLLDSLKNMYLTKVKGFNLDHMCVTTLYFEGDPEDVQAKEKKLYKIAEQNGGIFAGEGNGERGYMFTFVIAYVRDLALDYGVVAESFETSVAWDRTVSLCNNVKQRIIEECKARGFSHYAVSCRVTQTYDTGCCAYFYFGYNYEGHADPLRGIEEIKEKAQEEILASGGSLSHHHGIGKLRRKWLPGLVSPLGVSLYHATKRQLDPNNIFAVGNLHKSNL